MDATHLGRAVETAILIDQTGGWIATVAGRAEKCVQDGESPSLTLLLRPVQAIDAPMTTLVTTSSLGSTVEIASFVKNECGVGVEHVRIEGVQDRFAPTIGFLRDRIESKCGALGRAVEVPVSIESEPGGRKVSILQISEDVEQALRPFATISLRRGELEYGAAPSLSALNAVALLKIIIATVVRSAVNRAPIVEKQPAVGASSITHLQALRDTLEAVQDFLPPKCRLSSSAGSSRTPFRKLDSTAHHNSRRRPQTA